MPIGIDQDPVGSDPVAPRRGKPRVLAPSSMQVIPDAPVFDTPIALAPREVLDQAGNTFERALNVAALNEPCRVVLGRDRIGGQILNAWNYGGSLLVAVAWARGPNDANESITMSDAALPGTVLATHYLGAQTSADPKLVTALAALGVGHTAAFTGIDYSVFEFQPGADIGEFHAIKRGIKAYDPRNGTHVLATPSTWTWTDNPAVLLAAVITNTTWGMGAALDWTGSIAAFDACDALVSGEKKHLIGLTLDRRLRASEWVEIIREHAGCFVVREGAAYRLVPNAPASSVMTFSKANKNIVGRSLRWRRLGLADQPNVVQVTYTDTSAIPWRAAEVSVPANGLPPSGEELRLSRINIPGVQRYSQAVRVATERRNHARLCGVEFTWEGRGTAVRLRPGDVVTINDSALFAGRDVRLTNAGLRGKYETTLAARLYDPAAYSSSADAAPSYPVSTLPSASNPPAITGLTLSEISETPTTSRIEIRWTPVVWPFLAGYRILVYDEDRLLYDLSQVAEGAVVGPVAVGHRYQVRVSARSNIAEGAQTPAFITLAGVSTEIPGEMLWGEFDIRPDTGYDENTSGSPAFRRGLHDVYEGRAYRWALSAGGLEPMLWQSIPDGVPSGSSLPFSDAVDPIERYYVLLTVPPLPPSPGGDFEPPPLVGGQLVWRSSAIASVFAAGARVARWVADVPMRGVEGPTSLPEVRIAETALSTEIASNGSMLGNSVKVELRLPGGGGGAYAEIAWPGKLRVYVPTVTESIPPTAPLTSLTSGALTVTMQRVYDKLRFLPLITVLGSTPRQVSVTNIVYGASSTTFDVRISDGATNALVAEQFTYSAEGAEKPV